MCTLSTHPVTVSEHGESIAPASPERQIPVPELLLSRVIMLDREVSSSINERIDMQVTYFILLLLNYFVYFVVVV